MARLPVPGSVGCLVPAAARSRLGASADKARPPAVQSRTRYPRSFEVPIIAEPGQGIFQAVEIRPRRIAQFTLGLFGTEEHAIARHPQGIDGEEWLLAGDA